MEKMELNQNETELNMKELEQVNGGKNDGMISGKPGSPFPQPDGLPMPKPKPNNTDVSFTDPK